MSNLTYIVKTLSGLEPVLAAELIALGGGNVQELKRAVSFEGDQRLLYRANYELRTALRVLMPLHAFTAQREQYLYEGFRQVDWSRHLGVNDTLAIDAVVQGEVFRHSQYAAQLAKDAIVDQFRERMGRRPNVNVEAPTLRIHLRISGTYCEVLLDSSGDSLHKRGYRKDTVEAPLNEVLAAGMVLLAGWNGQSPFVDPMCGSGTLPIEAALIATRRPPQYLRPWLGFQKWKDYDAKLWKSVKTEADAGVQKNEFPLFASDKESRARNATSLNLMAAGLEAVVHVEKMPFEKLEKPAPTGLLMANPPYDERLKVDDVAKFYQSIGDRLKQQWAGWDAWLISSNREALKHVGLRTEKRITLFNGPLECSFQHFPLF